MQTKINKIYILELWLNLKEVSSCHGRLSWYFFWILVKFVNSATCVFIFVHAFLYVCIHAYGCLCFISLISDLACNSVKPQRRLPSECYKDSVLVFNRKPYWRLASDAWIQSLHVHIYHRGSTIEGGCSRSCQSQWDHVLHPQVMLRRGPACRNMRQKGLSFPHCPWAAQIPQGPQAGMRSRAVKGAAEGRVMPPGVSQPRGNREGRVGEGSREALWFKYAVARARAIWKPNLNICLQNQVMTGPLLSQGGQENGPCTCHLIQFKTWHIYQEWAGIMNFIHAVSGVNNLSPTAFVSLAAVPLIGLRYLFK